MGNAFRSFPLLLHPISKGIDMTGFTFILTVALAAAFVLLVVGLVAVIIYYRCRLKESHRTLARFIKENILLQEKTNNNNKTISQ